VFFIIYASSLLLCKRKQSNVDAVTELVQLINLLQSEAIEKISFYKVTTEFAEELKEDPSFETVQLTGHSLGGGLAIISGAQSRLPAVALSGPNAMLSGKSFKPQVLPEELNRYTFNIVPDRDIVARFDDVADQFQRIRCTAPANDFVQCHGFTRSLCEIIYTCGTGDRPALCECHTLLGYPKPTTDGEQNFDDLCPPPS
jgi:lipase ATG15